MRTRLVAVTVAVVAAGLFVANGFTRTIPVALAAGLWGGTVVFLLGYWRMARVLYPADPPPPLAGPPVAKARWLTGSIGTMRMTNHLSMTVYADRLVLGLSFVARRTIMAGELGPFSTHGTQRPEIRIEHRAAGLDSPVTLRLREDHPVRRALMELVR